MSIKNKFLKIIGFIGLFFSAVFYVLFKQKKDEEREEMLAQLTEELKQLKETNSAEVKQNEKIVEILNYQQEQKRNEEQNLENIADNKLSNFNAGLDLLRK